MTARVQGGEVKVIGGVPWTRNTRQDLKWVLLFLSPWIIGFVVLTAGPMLWTLYLSFTNYNPIRQDVKFIGLDNYARMLQDRHVLGSLYNTIFYTVLHVPLSMGIALFLALMLNRIGGRGAGFFRTAFYVPNLTPAVAVGTLFLMLLNGNSGLVNEALGFFGINGPSWLNDPTWVKPGIIIMSLWTVGNTVVIYFAAIKNVPVEMYEAARIEGANAWAQFRSITVPMISGALFFTFIINTIASLQLFSEVYTMFFGGQQGQSSGAGEAALFYVIYLFQQAFQVFRMGYASALAWLLFAVIMVITIIQVRVSRRFVYYEGE
jgi:multiple sugar transport system permease protein